MGVSCHVCPIINIEVAMDTTRAADTTVVSVFLKTSDTVVSEIGKGSPNSQATYM